MDDTIILELGDTAPLRLRHCYEGIMIMGATGSGKTSGSGDYLARSLLKNNLGGLVLCAKSDEAKRWSNLAAATGRAKDICLISPESDKRFNFLRYEQKRPGRGAGHTENIVDLLYEAIAALERGQAGGQSNDPYWERAAKALLRNAITLVLLADARLTLDRLIDIILEMSELSDAASSDPSFYNANLYRTEYARLVDLAVNKTLTPRQKKDLKVTDDYWRKEFKVLKDTQRASIISVFTSMADGLRRGVLADLFGTTTNIVPELSREGTIFILDLDVKEFLALGKIAQIIFKTQWQKAMERIPQGRPVFLFADECHNFITQSDLSFQSTTRSARVVTCLLTQNYPLLQTELGGKDADTRIDALMGNLKNKFFHANDCKITNAWASELIQQEEKNRIDLSKESWQSRKDRQWRVPPETFLYLRTGGTDFDYKVDGIFFRAPDWRLVTFDQHRPRIRQ